MRQPVKLQEVLLVAMLIGAVVVAGCAGSRPPGTVRGPAGVPTSDRGPGTKRMDLAALALPEPRTFELTHVKSAAFAQALGKDVTRIFEFVRDNIAFEAYSGVLRGPRGTLLAMAGNSADRAGLLASLLTDSGYQVRYAKGMLSERDARELVASMWVPVQKPPVQNKTASDAAKSAVQALVRSGKRDYQRIRDALKGAKTADGQAVPSLDTLVEETRTHYWVQVAKDGTWTDLDSSFADSTAGRSYARLDEKLQTLPPSLYHRVTLRIMVEESDGTRSRTEELATNSVNAADLSAVEIMVVHVPENWRGPVRSIQGALSSALSETGRIKPVLLIDGQQPVVGSPFRVRLNTSGAGGVTGLLGGEGTRRPLEIATAEWIEFKFDYPDGRSETVVREVFDLVGKAKRARNESLNPAEIKTLATGDQTSALMTTFFSVFLTTGRLDAAHLAGLSAETSSQAHEERKGAVPLRRLAVTFYLISDALLARVGTPERAVIRFYPDSPRVFISEFSARAKRVRLAVDLRRDHARAVAAGPNLQSAFTASVLHGVVDGTLERVVVAYVAARIPGTIDLKTGLSTSLLFEQADEQRVPAVLVASEQTRLDASIPEDARARLFDDVRQGNYALAPQHAIRVADVPRYAWWRINRQTGETVAVTDDGLHQTSTERMFVVDNGDGTFDVWVEIEEGTSLPAAEGLGIDALADFIFEGLLEGFEVIGPL